MPSCIRNGCGMPFEPPDKNAPPAEPEYLRFNWWRYCSKHRITTEPHLVLTNVDPTPAVAYPILMAYILDRSTAEKPKDWCAQLRIDEQNAFDGDDHMKMVAFQLERAQADYKAQQEAKGFDGYPYNRAMGEFLGLPIESNNEPPHGYYMSSGVMHHYRWGVATREVKQLLASGAILIVPLAKSKTTGKPCRFARFNAEQIKLGRDVIASDGKRKFTLSSNWSVETCMENLAAALRTGQPYGQR